MALIFLIVTGCAAAIAVSGSHGPSRAARAAVVVAVLAAPLLTASDAWIALGLPDHFGTGVFLLVSFRLIDCAAAARCTAPLLGAILCAGQISDVTVRYVAVPAIALVCAYQMAVARTLRTRDAANLLAALLSVPLALAIRRAMLHFGWYLMVAPNTKIAPVGRWPHNIAITWVAVRELFGAADGGSLLAAARSSSATPACWWWRSAFCGCSGAGAPRAGSSRCCWSRSPPLSPCTRSPPWPPPGRPTTPPRAAVRGGARGAGPCRNASPPG